MHDKMDFLDVFAEYDEDAIYQETICFINGLRDSQQTALTDLSYLGWGDYGEVDWSNVYKPLEGDMGDLSGDYF